MLLYSSFNQTVEKMNLSTTNNNDIDATSCVLKNDSNQDVRKHGHNTVPKQSFYQKKVRQAMLFDKEYCIYETNIVVITHTTLTTISQVCCRSQHSNVSQDTGGFHSRHVKEKIDGFMR